MASMAQELTPSDRFDVVKEYQDAVRSRLRAAVGGRSMAGPPIVIGPQDPQILGELIRYRCLNLRRLKVNAGYSSDENLRRRLRRLREADFVRTRPGFNGEQIYMPTPRALRLAGLDPRPTASGAGQLEHRLIVAKYGSTLEARGWHVLTEVELMFDPRRVMVVELASHPKLRPSDGPHTHRPDMVIRWPGETTVHAVELELTQKSSVRLDDVMGIYRRTPHVFDCVVYQCKTNAIAEAVRDAARRRGLNRIQVMSRPE